MDQVNDGSHDAIANTAVPRADGSISTDGSVPSDGAIAVDSDRGSRLDGRRILSIDEVARLPNTTRFLIDGLVHAPGLTIVAGSPKTKKTLLMTWACLCMTRGQPFLGRETRNWPIIYSFCEDDPGIVGERLRCFNYQIGSAPLWQARFGVRGEGGFRETRDLVETSDTPLLWIVDPLIEVLPILGVKDENNSIEVSQALRRLDETARASRSAVVVVHHFRKAGDVMRGSSAMPGVVGAWWNVIPQADDRFVVEVTSRVARSDSIGGEFRIDGDNWSFVGLGPMAATKPRHSRSDGSASTGSRSGGHEEESVGQNENRVRAIAAYLISRKGHVVKATEIISEMVSCGAGEGSRGSEWHVRKILDRLAEGDMVMRSKAGRDVVYQSTPALEKVCSEATAEDGAGSDGATDCAGSDGGVE